MLKPSDCKWRHLCDCAHAKSTTCEKCEFYYPIDSGYGVCKALPVFEVVGWCRDVCGLFGKRKPKKGE